MTSTLNTKKNNRTLLLLICAVILVAIVTFVLHAKHQKNTKIEEVAANLKIDGTVLPTPRVIHDFHMTDNHGQSFSNTNLKHHWTMMFFGFTNCGYVCPTTLAALEKMMVTLKTDLPEPLRPMIVMVSVDPERDTVARINDYVKSFDPQFMGIRGTLAETNALANQMSVVFSKVTMPNGQYMMNHSAEIMLLDPNGNLRAFFSYPHEAMQMRHDYKAIVNAYQKFYAVQ